MMKLLLILVLQLTGLFAQPDWTGTFIVDKSCDAKKCCCFDGRITIESKSSSRMLTLNAGVSGAALYCGTAHTLTFPRPQTSSTMIVSDGDKFYFQLNSEGTHLSITYDQEDSMKCFGNAVKISG